jgi:thiamine pyrophosphate-dependent acetolactate synthase large subunit-like protein
MAKKKIADLLVDVLAEAGVRRIYVRHEETAAFAAGAS